MLLNEVIRIKEGTIVYHGAMEDFDTFDINRIGESNVDKGGWGIYLTESESVARQYTPEGKGIIKKFLLPSGKYFDLDSEVDEGLFKDLMEHLKYYNKNVFNETESFREEISEYDYYDYGLTGLSFYNILSHDFGSTKEMSLFLKDYGFRGNTFLDKTITNVRNYVLFSSQGLRNI